MDSEHTFETALGWISISWSQHGLRTLNLSATAEPRATIPPDWIREAAEQITRHLAGEASDLASISLDLEGLPDFRRRVLEALRHTHPGQLLTYGELAFLAGSPGAARAVGQAVAKNPLPILIPCHRVVASNGPGGFSLFGSLETKQRLIELEQPGHTQGRCRALFPMNF